MKRDPGCPCARPPQAWSAGGALAIPLLRRLLALLLALAGLGLSPPVRALNSPGLDSIMADQIPRDVVAAMALDGGGMLWLATGDGVARFDGLHLQPMELSEGTRPAKRNLGWVRALLAGRDGRVWMGTETRGLAVYDPHQERLHLLEPDAGGQPTLLALAEDREGAIWSGGQYGGLRRVRLQDGRIVAAGQWHADGRPGSLPDERVLALALDEAGRLVVGTGAGLVRREGERFEELAPELAGRRVQALYRLRSGALWAGTAEGDLLRLDAQDRRLHLPPSAAGAVTALTEPVAGELWVGRERGIEQRDADSGALRQWWRATPLQPGGLRGDVITALLSDGQGVTWVAGLGVGLQRHDRRNVAFRVRGPDPDPGSPLGNASVRALLQDRDGRIWAATETGIAVLDEDLGTAHAGPRLPARVEAMAAGPDGRIWLAGLNVLHEVDAGGRLLRTLRHDGGNAQRLLYSRDGRLWLATSDGLWLLERGARALRRVGREDGQPLRGEIHALAVAPDGALWVGSSYGLLRLPLGRQALARVESPPGQRLGHSVVIGLLFDRAGRLWVDTGVSGLHRMTAWDGRQARFDRIGERLGAAGRPFGANLLEDGQGRIWSQMQVYDPATDRLRAIGYADGVRIGMPWFFAYTALRDGRMLFGGTQGILQVKPDAWAGEPIRPRLRISGIDVDGRAVAVAAAAAGPALEVPARTQRVSIQVALLGVADAGRLRYQYRLDGLDTQWQASLPGQRQLSLLQPAPGAYTLRLRAAPQAPELQLALRVLPAWWQTRWAWAGAVALLAAAFFGLVRWRTHQLLHRQRELEARVQERTQALQDSSLTDPLTGLRNRRYLQERVEGDCAAARQRVGQPAADLVFFLIDLDHFKQLNDAHGHAAGDAVLQQIRSRLQAVFRASDAMLRWGGEEFLVVARDSDRSQAPEIAERLRACMAAQPFQTPAGNLHVTCSVGYAAYPLAPAWPQALSWEDTLAAADAALYAAKEAGRNRWQGLEQIDAPADQLHALLTADGPGRVVRRGP